MYNLYIYTQKLFFSYIQDVSSLYTNIGTDDGLTIVEEELEKTGLKQPSAKTLTCLLKLNYFTFNDENFVQVKGKGMGTRAAPNFANVYMGRLEERFVYQTDWFNDVIDWVRFIDDIFLIWKGNKDSLNIAFIEYVNGVGPWIKFTYEISCISVNFLDTKHAGPGEGTKLHARKNVCVFYPIELKLCSIIELFIPNNRIVFVF